MGSYLSVVNDTEDPWQCKVGPDMAALKIASIVVGSFGALATVIGTAGMAAPVIAASGAGSFSVFGVSSTALATVTAGATAIAPYTSIIGGVSGFNMLVVKNVADNLNKGGYQTIPPGGRHRWGKKTLSLWQQSSCVKTVIVNEKTVRVETLNMRPIFTGATANSNRDYMIKHWLEKKGTEKEEIVAKAGEGRSMDNLDELEAELRSADPDVQIYYFYPNGTSTYPNTTVVNGAITFPEE